MSRLGERPSFMRLVRYVAAGLFVALGLALSANSLSGYRVVQRALQTVIRGQGESLMQSVERLTRRGFLSEAELRKQVLDSESARGLRCLVVFAEGPGPVREPSLVIGSCATPSAEWAGAMNQQRRGELVKVGERMRMVMGPPPRGPQRPGDTPPPPHGGPPPHGEPGGGRPPPPRPLLLEFEPQMAAQLEQSATRTLLSGALATLALLLAAAIFWRLSLRQERAHLLQERQRQLASLGEMAAVLAHELRNPMAALKGHAQLLLEQLQEGTRPHDKAARVVSEAERLEALSEDLLSFVRNTTIEPHNISPGELLRECVAEVNDTRIDLSMEKAPQRWRLDPSRMQQVLCNLLRNAVEASPPAGRVSATASVDGGELLFTIRDHGKGIREQDLERIFEPFYTTRARGTGLGLAIARRLVSLHGGSLAAENAVDGGALFRVRLPNAARSGTQLKGV